MVNMKLIKYKVEKFKSIMNSGWIDCDDVTTLVGVNEAGKSNLLLALWKLNPAMGGKIKFSDDMPVKFFSDMRVEENKAKFITAIFEITSDNLLEQISDLGYDCVEKLGIVQIAKDYDDKIYVEFPNFEKIVTLNTALIVEELKKYEEIIDNLSEVGTTEKGIKDEVLYKIKSSLTLLGQTTEITIHNFIPITDIFGDLKSKSMQKSEILPQYKEIKEYIINCNNKFCSKNPSEDEDVLAIIKNNIPKFVYYSNYGNLDSEIYLPHVIENMNRKDLPNAMEAKTRTLKVLFEYVKLDPNEILQMGVEEIDPTEEKIKLKAEKKKERDILLQSASAKLTRDFKDWWSQGNYNFEFSADGRHFRIWVSDEVRPERIVLENRSTGLQWFLSFYLIFLVESKDSHSGAIVLLDEAGLSLHPLAQKDLSLFFTNLAKTNQIINTTHSPFLIDTNNIDKAKVVYVDKSGYTVASSDLRANQNKLNINSIYAIHSALGLSVSDVLLQGCKPIIVEGPSDQYYFNAIKLHLISQNKISPKEELVFIASGGVKAVSSIASLLSAKSDLPFVILDSDKSGQDFYSKLSKSLYKDALDKIVTIKDICSMENSEVEDLIPYDMISKSIDRLFNTDLDFFEYYNNEKSLIPQLELFADENDIVLPNGYKVDLARSFKQQLLKNKSCNIDSYISMWETLFNKFLL